MALRAHIVSPSLTPLSVTLVTLILLRLHLVKMDCVLKSLMQHPYLASPPFNFHSQCLLLMFLEMVLFQIGLV